MWSDLFTPFHMKSRSCQYHSYYYALGLTRLEIYPHIGKGTRLRTVTSKWFPAMSAVCTCISGSSQAFPKPECSYSKWERSRGSPNTTTIFPTYIFMKDDELSKIRVPPHSPLPPNTHLHQNCWCRGGNQGTAGQSVYSHCD